MRTKRRAKRPVVVALATALAGAVLVSVPMFAGAAVETAAFCANATTENRFSDVVVGDPNIANINCLVSSGITMGVTPGTYEPDGTVTRRQMALFIKRMIDTANTLGTGEPGLPALPAPDGAPDFSDLAGEAPAFAEAIGRLDQAGIIDGRADGTYGPADSVSRGAMAKFVANAMELLTGEPLDGAGTDQFPDDDDSVFRDFIDRLGANDIVDGDGEGNYNPTAPVTRRQMASFLVRPLQVLYNAGAIEATPDVTKLVRLKLQLEPLMAGGVWMISTRTGADQTEVVVLQEGIVPANGTLIISLAPETAGALSSSSFFFLSALNVVNPTDATTGHAVDVTVGLSDEDMAGGSITDFGSVPSEIVPVSRADEDASLASGGEPSTDPCCAEPEPADVVSPPPPQPELAAADRPEAVMPTVEPASSSNPDRTASPALLPESGVLPAPECAEGEYCGSSASVRIPVADVCNRYVRFMSNCLVAARDIPGVKSFRGYSHRPAGALTTFIVKAGSQQQWQNAVRSSAGPFKASGTTTRTTGRSTTDTFPLQGDCWKNPDLLI